MTIPSVQVASTRRIQLIGVRVQNLKNIDLEIPHGQKVALCGRSGSGKSSLAIDTLFAEGRRQYLSSFSPFARQLIGQAVRPDVDRVRGILPAIAFRADHSRPASAASVGSLTEIAEHLHLLFARFADPFCPFCRRDVQRHSPQTVRSFLASLPEGLRFQVGFDWPVASDLDRASSPNAPSPGVLLMQLNDLRRAGFNRVILDDQTWRIADLLQADWQTLLADRSPGSGPLKVVLDRLKTGGVSDRLAESLETAFTWSPATTPWVLLEASGAAESTTFAPSATSATNPRFDLDGGSWYQFLFPQDLRCTGCQRALTEPEPGLFHSGHPAGRCSDCQGRGNQSDGTCPACQGSGLRAEALDYRYHGKPIDQLCRLPVGQLFAWFRRLKNPEGEPQSGSLQTLLDQIVRRLDYLQQVHLEYLTLDRRAATLSKGEFQRVKMAAVLGTSLVNLLLVLDEPSAGLHPHDIQVVDDVIGHLHRRGNTLVVVDHHPELIRNCDRLIEIGPGQGSAGGEIVFDGSFEDMLRAESSLTGQYLSGRRGFLGIEKIVEPRQSHSSIDLSGASGNNLKSIDVRIPLGVLCVVTGVSGAGKHSLVCQTLYPWLANRLHDRQLPTLPLEAGRGGDSLQQVVLIDDQLPAKSNRSNPVTWIKAFDLVRKLFAETPEARASGLTAGHFSFNVAGGRCDQCKGSGYLQIDMPLLPEMIVGCDHCQGRRFETQVLSAKYRGLAIDEVLHLTVDEAFLFFRGQAKLQAKLKTLRDVGLGYLELGQPVATLSTGERRRLKLASFFGKTAKRRGLLILVEPTSGLHAADTARLLECFNVLLDVGHSLIVIEHNLQLIQQADYLIDIGPGADAAGGEVVATGSPQAIMNCQHSLTGRYLKEFTSAYG